MSDISKDIDNLQRATSKLRTENDVSDMKHWLSEQTRRDIARKFINFYFWILIAIIISVPAYDYVVYIPKHDTALLISLKDTVLTYSAVVGPTLGLVIAHYFKSDGQ